MAVSGMISEKYPDLLALPDEDKLKLAGELWSDVIGDAVDVERVSAPVEKKAVQPETVAAKRAGWPTRVAPPTTS